MTRISRHGFLICALFGLLAATAAAQVITSISPSTIAAGSKSFVLTVTGSGFDPGAVVELDGQGRQTVPSSTSVLKALVDASDVATGGTILVTVDNSDGSVSDAVQLTVTGKRGPPPPPPSPVTVTISSPSQHQTVCSPVTLSASAVTATKGANVIRFVVTEHNGNQLYSANGVHSIDTKLTVAAGVHNLTVEAYDSAGVTGFAPVNFTVTTSTAVCGTKPPPPPVGPVTSFRGCILTQVGLNYQAIDVTLDKAVTLPVNAKLYHGSGCVTTELADQINFGENFSFDAISYIFWFSDFLDDPDTSAIWTVGSQSSGCINYSSAPPC